jgi:hypothetical protein
MILVARERLGEEAVADAATLSACITLSLMSSMRDGPHVMAEVLEKENLPLLEHKAQRVSPPKPVGIGLFYRSAEESWLT